MTLALRFAARSHQGLLRTLNEDSVYAGHRLLAVADGMGGHAAGEVASAVAIAALAPLDEDAPGADLLAALREAATSANDHLHDLVEADEALQGMGTTLVAVLFAGSRLGLLHVGDSRAYLLRDDELTQITHDHTFVQTLVDEGRITEEEASNHPQRNVITRALDGRDDVELDLSVREVRVGDRYLLCSDGLTGPVGSLDTLREALLLPDPQDAVDRLVQLALKGGGPDNVTVIVADAIDSDGSAADQVVVAGAAAQSPQAPPPGLADSPASRARVAEGRDVEAPAASSDDSEPGRRFGRRRALALIVMLGLLVGGAGSGWSYVRSQYYVGLDGEKVAVYRGVKGSVAGLRLATVEEPGNLSKTQLSDPDQERVEQGIVATDLSNAKQIVQRLKEQVTCATPTPTPPATVKPVPAPKATVRPAAAPAATAVPGRTPVATPTSTTPPSPGTGTNGTPCP